MIHEWITLPVMRTGTKGGGEACVLHRGLRQGDEGLGSFEVVVHRSCAQRNHFPGVGGGGRITEYLSTRCSGPVLPDKSRARPKCMSLASAFARSQVAEVHWNYVM